MKTSELIKAMIDFYGSSHRDQIEHTLAVYGYAQCIAENEGFSEMDKTLAIFAALLHDTGIKIGKDKSGSCTHKEQEEFGPPVAKEILGKLGIDMKIVDRICWLIGHHHTPELVKQNSGKDFQALIEADFLANLDEGYYPLSQAQKIEGDYFRTSTGRHLIETMFLKRTTDA
jgi:HD superfamily phosphodiesterase